MRETRSGAATRSIGRDREVRCRTTCGTTGIRSGACTLSTVFAADADVTSYVVTGQDAEIPSVQYIIDGKQSMTVLKDARTVADAAIAAAVAFLEGGTPEQTATYNNGKIDVPAKPAGVVTVDQSNWQAALIDSGYYDISEFTVPE